MYKTAAYTHVKGDMQKMTHRKQQIPQTAILLVSVNVLLK